jgi:hypothetical protein
MMRGWIRAPFSSCFTFSLSISSMQPGELFIAAENGGRLRSILSISPRDTNKENIVSLPQRLQGGRRYLLIALGYFSYTSGMNPPWAMKLSVDQLSQQTGALPAAGRIPPDLLSVDPSMWFNLADSRSWQYHSCGNSVRAAAIHCGTYILWQLVSPPDSARLVKNLSRSITVAQNLDLSQAYCTQPSGLFESELASPQWQRKQL